MKEAFWGVLIVMLGMLGIVIIQVFQNVTVTNDQTYYLLKEVTEASMLDSIDLTYYRTKGKIRIVEDKFVENMTRRFAQSASTTKEYNIVIHDIVEDPPKVNLSIGTYVFSLQGDKYEIGQTLNSIIESKFTSEQVGENPVTPPPCVGDECSECKVGDIDCDGVCEIGESCYDCEGEECELCPVCDASDPNCGQITECIAGDLRFTGWENVNILNPFPECQELPAVNRIANYQSCECGKWVDKQDTIASNITKTPAVKPTTYKYNWRFFKQTEVRTLDVPATKDGIFSLCTTDLNIKINCPDQMIVGQKHTIVPKYIPENAVNKDLKWTSSKTNIAIVEDSIVPPTTGTDDGTVTARAKGTTTITATTTNNKSDSCDIDVIDKSDWKCPTPNPIKMYTNTTYKIGSTISGVTYSVDSNYATIAADGTITSKGKTGNIKYTIKASGLNPLQCDLQITRNPNWRCPEPAIVMNTNSVANIKLPNNFKPPGIKYRIDNTSIAVVYSQGQIDSKDTAATINYYINATDYPELKCPLTIKKPSTSTGCTVGTITASFSKSSLPTLCPQDIDKNSFAYREAIKTVASPSFCGKDGNFTSCSNGKYVKGDNVYFVNVSSSDTYDNTPGQVLSVRKEKNSYTVSWTINYKYGGWNAKAFTCPYLKDRNLHPPITKTLSGTLKSETAPGCADVSGTPPSPMLTIANLPNEIIAGSTAVNLYASYSPANAYNPNEPGYPIKWEIVSGPGTLTKQSDNSGKYTPPTTVSKSTTVKIKMSIYDKTDPNDMGYTYVEKSFPIVPYMECKDFEIYPEKNNKLICVGEPYRKLNLRYKDNTAFTANVQWGISGEASAIQAEPSLNQYSTYLSVKALKDTVKNVTITADKQVGQCPNVENPRLQLDIGKYEPYCSTTYYPQLYDGYGNDDYCYNPNSSIAPKVCPSGTAYYSGTGKCHPSDAVNSTTTSTCSSGIKYYSYSKNRYVCGTTESKVCPDSTYTTDPNYTPRCRKCPSGSKPDPYNSYKCRKCPDGFFPYNSEECKKGGMVGPYISVDYLYKYKECPNDEYSGICYKYLKDTTNKTTYSCDYSYTLITENGKKYCIITSFGVTNPNCPSGYRMKGDRCYYAYEVSVRCKIQ